MYLQFLSKDGMLANEETRETKEKIQFDICQAKTLSKKNIFIIYAMFRNTYQGGFLSILYSCGSAPLELWDMHVSFY